MRVAYGCLAAESKENGTDLGVVTESAPIPSRVFFASGWFIDYDTSDPIRTAAPAVSAVLLSHGLSAFFVSGLEKSEPGWRVPKIYSGRAEHAGTFHLPGSLSAAPAGLGRYEPWVLAIPRGPGSLRFPLGSRGAGYRSIGKARGHPCRVPVTYQTLSLNRRPWAPGARSSPDLSATRTTSAPHPILSASLPPKGYYRPTKSSHPKRRSTPPDPSEFSLEIEGRSPFHYIVDLLTFFCSHARQTVAVPEQFRTPFVIELTNGTPADRQPLQVRPGFLRGVRSTVPAVDSAEDGARRRRFFQTGTVCLYLTAGAQDGAVGWAGRRGPGARVEHPPCLSLPAVRSCSLRPRMTAQSRMSGK